MKWPIMEGYAGTDPRVRYRMTGTGPYLVMAPGLWGRSVEWEPFGWVDALAPGHTLVMIDSRSYGSEVLPVKDGFYSMDSRASDVLTVMDALGIAQAHYFGYSMGGKMAYSLMGPNERRFLSYAILSSAPTQFQLKDLRDYVSKRFPDSWEFPEGMTLSDGFKLFFLSHDKDAILTALDDRNWPDRTESFRACGRNSLVIMGEKESPEDLETMRYGASLSSRCETRLIPGMDHDGLVFHGEIVAPVVREFLDRQRN